MRPYLRGEDTVEPLNKGYIGIRSTVPCREAVLISEVNLKVGDISFCRKAVTFYHEVLYIELFK